MAIASLALPRLVRIGGGVSLEAGEVLRGLGLKCPLIVSDRFLEKSGYVDPIERSLATAGCSSVRRFTDAVPDPTIASIEAGIDVLRAGDHDCVIGIGGGSAIDTAKAIAVFSQLDGQIASYRAPHRQDAPGVPIVAIPTTAGTGSEVTRFVVITDETTNEKLLCVGLAYMPVAALVDFELTLKKPPRLTADTGIDAFTHAIEAYVSRHANSFSDALALSAARAIFPNLERVWVDPGDRAAREALMFGATQAGMAFSNSSVALVHGMSRPISAFFHVPHGLANAMLLPTVTEFSAPSAQERYAEFARASGMVSPNESDAAAIEQLIAGLKALNRKLEVPTPQQFGITENAWRTSLAEMAEQALASGSPANNPRVPSATEIANIYRLAAGLERAAST